MVYVASDLKIKESDERDQDIIRGWNSVITDEDWVLLTGIITPSKEAASVKRIFDTLKGEKRIMDISFKNSDEVERLKFITGNQPYQISGFVPGIIQGKEVNVVLPINADQLKREKDRKNYCAGAGSLLNQEEVYQDKCLDISIDRWGFIPIVYTDIPVLINNILTYD